MYYFPDTQLLLTPVHAETGFGGRPKLNQEPEVENCNIPGVDWVIFVVLYTHTLAVPDEIHCHLIIINCLHLFPLCRERWTERVTNRSFSPLFPSSPVSSVVWVYSALP